MMWTTDDKRKLELAFLKKHNYLDNGISSGGISWYRHEEKVGSIEVTVNCIDLNNSYIQLIYTYTKYDIREEKEDINYKIRLDWDPVHFGGKRWFFICPAIKNDGSVCHKRVRDIYQSGKYFVCRKCADLVYDSQTISKNFRGFPWGTLEIDNYFEKKVKRTHYNGKPTKKYQTYLNKRKRLGESYHNSNKEDYFL